MTAEAVNVEPSAGDSCSTQTTHCWMHCIQRSCIGTILANPCLRQRTTSKSSLLHRVCTFSLWLWQILTRLAMNFFNANTLGWVQQLGFDCKECDGTPASLFIRTVRQSLFFPNNKGSRQYAFLCYQYNFRGILGNSLKVTCLSYCLQEHLPASPASETELQDKVTPRLQTIVIKKQIPNTFVILLLGHCLPHKYRESDCLPLQLSCFFGFFKKNSRFQTGLLFWVMAFT